MNHIGVAKTTFKSHLEKGQIISKDKASEFFTIETELEEKLFSRWLEMITTFSFLERPQENIEEIFIFSPSEIIYKYAHLKQEFISDITGEDLQIALECLVISNGIGWNYSHPFVSFQTNLFGRSARVSLSHHSISSKACSSCFIRFQSTSPFSLTDFGDAPHEIISKLITEKKNILIAGGTGSGKTSFLNSLLELTDKEEHIVFLEDTAELKSPHPRTTSLITNDHSESNNLKTYMGHALRMSPDRIVLGEIRSAEVESFLLAMNTGHKGLISTIHSNSAVDTLNRIALLFKVYSSKDLSFDLVLKLACTNIDAVVFLEHKKVVEIIQVFGSEQSNIFFEQIFNQE